MPHAELMDEKKLGPVEGPLMRAKLHIRSGRRRLREGKISAGILTLYDALWAAMDWYFAVPERCNRLDIKQNENFNDDKTMYRILTRSGILDESFDYIEFDALVSRAMESDLPEYDYSEMLNGIESVMTRLGVMPFDEDALPKEKPGTF